MKLPEMLQTAILRYTGHRMQDWRCRVRASELIRYLFSCGLVFLALLPTPVHAADLSEAIAGLQKRYASVETVKGSFQQSYRAPGIQREQTGEFWLKKPGLMRWEYKTPDVQLFIADGRKSYLYVPDDRQVTIQPLSPADLHNTPLSFLLGSGDINKTYFVAWESEYKRKAANGLFIRLIPRRQPSEYSFLALELDPQSYDLRRIIVREPGGSTSEFLLSGVITNTKFDNGLFQFKKPKGVEEVRLNNED